MRLINNFIKDHRLCDLLDNSNLISCLIFFLESYFLCLKAFFGFLVASFLAASNVMDTHWLSFFSNFNIWFCINVCVCPLLKFDKLVAYFLIIRCIKDRFQENLNRQNM
jgi:hypothetical protein